eukprot:scaffold144929_cov25-Tisochrysis_lutea.AAC.2
MPSGSMRVPPGRSSPGASVRRPAITPKFLGAELRPLRSSWPFSHLSCGPGTERFGGFLPALSVGDERVERKSSERARRKVKE